MVEQFFLPARARHDAIVAELIILAALRFGQKPACARPRIGVFLAIVVGLLVWIGEANSASANPTPARDTLNFPSDIPTYIQPRPAFACS